MTAELAELRLPVQIMAMPNKKKLNPKDTASRKALLEKVEELLGKNFAPFDPGVTEEEAVFLIAQGLQLVVKGLRNLAVSSGKPPAK